MAARGIPGVRHPEEWWRRRIPDAICPGGMNVVMSSMKDRHELYGYGGLSE